MEKSSGDVQIHNDLTNMCTRKIVMKKQIVNDMSIVVMAYRLFRKWKMVMYRRIIWTLVAGRGHPCGECGVGIIMHESLTLTAL